MSSSDFTVQLSLAKWSWPINKVWCKGSVVMRYADLINLKTFLELTKLYSF